MAFRVMNDTIRAADYIPRNSVYDMQTAHGRTSVAGSAVEQRLKQVEL